MLETEEEQLKFYMENIQLCLGCYKCPIVTYCGDKKNDLDVTCWTIYQNWLKDKIFKESEVNQ